MIRALPAYSSLRICVHACVRNISEAEAPFRWKDCRAKLKQFLSSRPVGAAGLDEVPCTELVSGGSQLHLDGYRAWGVEKEYTETSARWRFYVGVLLRAWMQISVWRPGFLRGGDVSRI